MRWAIVMATLLGVLIQWGPGEALSAAAEPAQIVFLTWKPNQPEIWQRLVHAFQNRHPQIRVLVQLGPHSSTDYHAILSQRLKNRDPSVDIFFMDVVWPPEFASAGWAMDLTGRFPPGDQEEFLPGPIAANTFGGKIYGVPCYVAAGLLYYRKDLLARHGLLPPTSWEEMLIQGRGIQDKEGEGVGHIYSAQFKQYEGLVCNMLEFIRSHGGDVLDSRSGRSPLAEAPARRAVGFVRDRIVGRAAPQGVVNYEEPESLNLFVQGKAIFHRNWPYAWDVANDPSKSKVAGKVGRGELPAFSGHKPASTLGGWQFGINRWSRRQEEAWRFVQFMTSPEAQKALAMEAGLAPGRRSVYRDPDLQAKRPHLGALLQALENALPRPLSPVYPMISQELQRFFSYALLNKEINYSLLAGRTSATIEKLYAMGAAIHP